MVREDALREAKAEDALNMIICWDDGAGCWDCLSCDRYRVATACQALGMAADVTPLLDKRYRESSQLSTSDSHRH
jgi:hypothetical protein